MILPGGSSSPAGFFHFPGGTLYWSFSAIGILLSLCGIIKPLHRPFLQVGALASFLVFER